MIEASTWMELAITQAWQVTCLALVVWFASRLIARQRPHLAHILWALVLIKCITPPIVSSPTSIFSWLHYAGAASTAKQLDIARDTIPRDVGAMPSSIAKDVARALVGTGTIVATQPIQQPVQVELDDASTSSNGFHQLLLAALVLGALLGLGWTTFRLWLFLRRALMATAPPDERIRELVLQLSQELNVARPVRVLLVESSIGPAVMGLWRPTILLPAPIIRKKSVRSLRPLIAHELIHIRRGDLLWAMLQTLCTSLWWFHPLVWLASRMLTRESERACDEETIASLGCSPADYARELLDVLHRKHQLRVAPALPGVRPVDVTANRLERIMSLGHGSHRRPPRWAWPAMLIGAALVLPGRAWVAGQETNEAEPVPAAAPLAPASLGPWLGQWENASIDVGDLLARIDWLPDRGAAEAYLLSQLPIRSLEAINREGAEYGSQLSSRPRTTIDGKQLLVFETRDQIRKIRDRIAQLRDSGFDLVKLEIHIVSIPRQRIAEELRLWDRQNSTDNSLAFASFRALRMKKVEAASLMARHTKPAAQDASNARLAKPASTARASSAPKQPEVAENELLRRAAELEPAELRADHRVAATHHTFSPQELLEFLQFGLPQLDEQQIQDVFRQLQKSELLQILSRPTITTLSARTATARIGGNRLFVVDEASDSEQHSRDIGKSSAMVEILRDGIECSVFPRLSVDTKHLQLECRLSATGLARGEAEEHRGSPIPVLKRSAMDAAVNLPVGHTLAMTGISDPNDSQRLLMMLVTANLLPRAADAAVAKVPPQPKGAVQVPPEPKRVELLGPTTSGGKASATEAPSNDEVLRLLNLQRKNAGQPTIMAEHVSSITREKIADYVDPVRFVPLLGPSQMHHAHYRCQVELSADAAIPQATVYIDHQHFHMTDPVGLLLTTDAANSIQDAAEAELLQQLGEFGLTASVDGHFEHVRSGQSLVIRGRYMSVVQGDKNLAIEADRGEVVVKPGTIDRMNLSGNVRLSMPGLSITADIIRIEVDQLDASGSVKLNHTLSDTELTGEQLTWELATGEVHVPN